MRPVMLAALCLGWAGISVVRADPKIGSYAPDIEAKSWMNTDGQPLSLAEYRGMVVVLFCWGAGPGGGEAVMPMMTAMNNSVVGRRSGVFIIGVTDADQKRAAEVLQQEKAFFPVEAEAKATFEDYGLTDLPRVIIIDPAGKVAWAGWSGDRTGDALFTEVRKVLADTPPTKTHPEEAEKANAYLKQARQALREDKVNEAYRAANSAFDHALRGDALKTRCQDLLDLIEALGRDKLALAERALDEKKYEDAVTLLLELRREYRGLDVARSVNKKLAALEKKVPDVARIMKAHADMGQAESLLAAAMERIQERKFGPAYETLEQVAEEYASTETAAKAQTLLARMQQNDAVMGYVRDYKASRACRTLLSQADAYERTGRASRARELYREILDKYGDTIYADEAAQRLARMP